MWIKRLRRCFGERLGGFAAPEERWYRAVSMEFAQSRGCHSGANPELAHDAGDAHSMNGSVKRGVHSESLV
jgi:hypothetical protein